MSLTHKWDDSLAQKVREEEEKVDKYEDALGTYLVKLSSREMSHADSQSVNTLLHTISDFECISDHSVNVLSSAEEIHAKSIEFSKDAQEELQVLEGAVQDVLSRTTDAFRKDDLHLAGKVEPLETVVDELVRAIKARHVARLQTGSCSIEYGFVLEDLLTNYERVCDHCSNVAVAQIEVAQDSFDTHAYLNDLRYGNETKEVNSSSAVWIVTVSAISSLTVTLHPQPQRRNPTNDLHCRRRCRYPRAGAICTAIQRIRGSRALKPLSLSGRPCAPQSLSWSFWSVMLPGEDGFSILKKLRNTPALRRLPIIMVTAKSSELDTVRGLDCGADDYITKPFGIMEFLSRVRAALRRSAPEEKQNVYAFHEILLDNARHSVTVNGTHVDLTYKEYSLLRLLLENTNLVVTRETILQVVWGTDISVESRTVDMHIRSLQKAGDAGRYLHRAQVGYKLADSEEGEEE